MYIAHFRQYGTRQNLVDHLKQTAEILANGVFSHHTSSGLLDYLTSRKGEMVEPYVTRLHKKADLPDYQEVKQRFFSHIINENEFTALFSASVAEVTRFQKSHAKFHSLFFLNKLIYSCLLDADRTNTYLFEQNLPLIYRKVKRNSYFYDCSSDLVSRAKCFLGYDKSLATD